MTVSEPCNCGRLDCEACRQAYLRHVTEAATGTASQVLSGLKGLATALLQGIQEATTEICELPHETIEEEEACDAERLRGAEMPVSGHVYLSTSCLHDLHDRCEAGVVQLGLERPGDNGISGLKTPAQCKFCASPCVCGCHRLEKPDRWCCDGNAEDCALCVDPNPPYPFICPGHDRTPEASRTALVAAAAAGREALRAQMRRLRAWDRAESAVEPEREGEPGDVLDEVMSETDQEALRALVSQCVLARAVERVEREWICCDPVDESHKLCVQGRATINMLEALLTDDENAFPSRSDVLDVIMRFVLGASEPERRGSILTEAELRELYGKAIQAAVSGGMAWSDERNQPATPADVAHAVTEAVLGVRDRELRRNRQRLQLAQADWEQASTNLNQLIQQHEAAVATATATGRIAGLREAMQVLREENQTPYDAIALANPLARLASLVRRAESELDKPAEG